MKMKFIFLICFLHIFIGFSIAQEIRQKFIGIETGMTLIGNEITKMDNIRGDIPAYSGGYSTNVLTSLTYRSFIGVKPEIFSLNDKIGFMAGLRFSRINNSVGKNSYWSNSTNYFYWLYSQSGINTEYLKVKEINQKSDYIGIPIEVRYFPSKRPRLFRVYFKLGAEINYCLQTQTAVVFYDNAMNLYQKDLIATIGKPKAFNASVYGAGGFRIGRESGLSASIEVCLPYFLLTRESTGLVNPISGGGFQINFQIPLKSITQ